MSDPEIFLLRHGETEWNVAGRMQGWRDSPLTGRGRAQAARQGEILRAAGAQGLPLHCSPLGRAVTTARIALPEAEPRLDERLREITLGAWDGLTVAGMRALGSAPPASFGEAAGFAWYDTTPGERFAGLAARTAAFAREVTGPAVVVTHGIAARFLLGAWLGLDLAAMAALPGGQGVVHHLGRGRLELLG